MVLKTPYDIKQIPKDQSKFPKYIFVKCTKTALGRKTMKFLTSKR